MHSSPADAHLDAAWRRLVDAMYASFERLVDDFVQELVTWGYAPRLVPTEQVTVDARASFDHLLRSLAGLPEPESVPSVAAHIGRTRARAGVPLAELLSAVRLDFRVLWARLREVCGDGDLPLLMAHVDHVWEMVERYSSDVQRAYLAETAVMERETRTARSALVARVLDEQTRRPEDVHALAEAWEVDESTSFAVAATRADDAAPLLRRHQELVASGRLVHWQERPEGVLLIAQWLGDTGAEELFAGVDCGLGPVARGVGALAESAAVAEAVALEAPVGGGPVELTDVAAAVVVRRLGPLADALVRATLDSLEAAKDRAVLVETVHAFADTGSVSETAERLYCHRNTVLNRLHRFRDVTGRDPMVPRELQLVLLALACLEAGDSMLSTSRSGQPQTM